MDTKPLLYGLIGFFIGGLLVSVAATTFDKPTDNNVEPSMSMSEMTESLRGKTGDEFDKQFIAQMIDHHQGAIDMADLAKRNAKHQEIKQLADDILEAQSKEINMMEKWHHNWGYGSVPEDNQDNKMMH